MGEVHSKTMVGARGMQGRESLEFSLPTKPMGPRGILYSPGFGKMSLSGWATVPPRGRARKGKSHASEFPSPEQLKEEREPFAASGWFTGRGGGAEEDSGV